MCSVGSIRRRASRCDDLGRPARAVHIRGSSTRPDASSALRARSWREPSVWRSIESRPSAPGARGQARRDGSAAPRSRRAGPLERPRRQREVGHFLGEHVSEMRGVEAGIGAPGELHHPGPLVRVELVGRRATPATVDQRRGAQGSRDTVGEAADLALR